MKIKSNFHTHTYYCDGKDSPEELVLAAIDKGFSSIGFSGHSFLEFDKEYSMDIESQKRYIDDVTFAQEKYGNRIDVFCGIEQDYFSQKSNCSYDFIIGSVHYILKNDEYIPVDISKVIVDEAINKHYNGNFDEFAEDYFELVSDVVNKTNCDIIGHFDLISKFGCEQSERYLNAAEKAIKNLVRYNKLFEINTGAMARGIKNVPYPSKEILEIIKKYNGKIIFSSDCHDRRNIDFGFDSAVNLAIECGFTDYAILTHSGIEYLKLKGSI